MGRVVEIKFDPDEPVAYQVRIWVGFAGRVLVPHGDDIVRVGSSRSDLIAHVEDPGTVKSQIRLWSRR